MMHRTMVWREIVINKKRLYRHRPQIALQEKLDAWQERETSLGDIPLKAEKRMEKVIKT